MHDLEQVTSPTDSVSASGKSQQTPSSFRRGELVRRLALPVSERFAGARTVSFGPLHHTDFIIYGGQRGQNQMVWSKLLQGKMTKRKSGDSDILIETHVSVTR